MIFSTTALFSLYSLPDPSSLPPHAVSDDIDTNTANIKKLFLKNTPATEDINCRHRLLFQMY